jgi:uncharacterized membrane protein
MALRPISGRVRRWLIGEMEDWWKQGILTGDQADRILGLYETDVQIAQHKRVMAWFALSGVAAVMIGLAVLLLVGYNWSAMPATLKLAVIFGVLFGTHAAGFWLRFHAQRRTASEIVFLLGCLFFGAALSLIGQTFHIQSHYPDGIWFWAICVLPFALCLDTLLLHALFAGLLAAWVGTEILDFPGFRPWWFGHFYNGAYSLPLLALPGLLWAYRKQSAATVGLYSLLLAWWVILQPIAWHSEVDVLLFIAAAGALFLLIAEMHPIGSTLAVPYRLFGVLITGGALVPLSFGEFLCRMPYRGPVANYYLSALMIGLIGAAAVLGAIALQHRNAAAQKIGVPFAAILRRQWMPLLLLLLPIFLCLWCGLFNHYGYIDNDSYYDHYWSRPKDSFWAAAFVAVVVVNVVMLVFALWLMRIGLREERTWLFAGGVLYFLLWTVLRYVDLFAEAGGMLGTAAMFLLCGIGLFAVARFWLHQKGNRDA